MIFETERLSIRQWRAEEAEAVYSIYREPKVVEFLEGLEVESLEEQRARMPHLLSTYERYGEGFGVWAVEKKVTGEVLGTLLLKGLPDVNGENSGDIEVGWHLGLRHWGQGYATESARGALEHGFFKQGCEKIFCVVNPANVRSVAVAARLGMQKMGLTRKYYDGEEVLLYHLRRESFLGA